MKKVLLFAAIFAVNAIGCAGFNDHPMDGQTCCYDGDNDGYPISWIYSGWDGEWSEEEEQCSWCFVWGDVPEDCNDNDSVLNWDDVDGDGFFTCDGDPNDFDELIQPDDSRDGGN
ncbi:hypothetical protein KKC88_03160 [Patescibacteria group bacterium]|nr:hypothetical protein [Patescibacteria group bacterium]MBU1673421.1 hypothetical protein [Patescibacteria group bacterium]MBU1963325.1 hypothetical protein [Patescibacteria group bacterium]